MQEHVAVKKRTWGTLKGSWVPHDTRDEVVDFVDRWSGEDGASPSACWCSGWASALSKFYDWRNRYGKVNEHNARVPRDHWLEEWEKQAILDYERQYPLEGYRRLTFMMLDDDVAAASPATRLPRAEGGRSDRPALAQQSTAKGRASISPAGPHHHWHIDFSYLNICGTFYYLC